MKSVVSRNEALNANPVLIAVLESSGLQAPGGHGFGAQPVEFHIGSQRSAEPLSTMTWKGFGGLPMDMLTK